MSSLSRDEQWTCGICGDADVPEKFRVFGSCYRCAAQKSIDKRERKIASLKAEVAELERAAPAQSPAPPENLPDGWDFDPQSNSVTCSGCAFRYGAEHPDGDGKWICPNCGDGNATPQPAAQYDAVREAVTKILKQNKWPLYYTQNDRGLDLDEYVEFVGEVLAALSPRPEMGTTADVEPIEPGGLTYIDGGNPVHMAIVALTNTSYGAIEHVAFANYDSREREAYAMMRKAERVAIATVDAAQQQQSELSPIFAPRPAPEQDGRVSRDEAARRSLIVDAVMAEFAPRPAPKGGTTCNPNYRGGMICRKNYPGKSACTRYGGQAVCLQGESQEESGV